MRVLVLSDIHGNLPALEYVIKQEKTVDYIISLGDVVNYGPWSNECVDLMDSLSNKTLILGNHEDAFIKGKYLGTNLIAKTFFETCYPEFSRKEIIAKYVDEYTFKNCRFIHTINDAYIFPDTEVSINQNTFIGHSHRLFSKEVDGCRLVNVGSVGQNRTNIDLLNYVIWDTELNTVELMEREFKADLLINEMKMKGYPQLCLDYILSKRKS